MKAPFIEVDRWVGNNADPLDPAAMKYRAKLAPEDAGDCAGCIFKGQASKVCKVAGTLAVRAGMPDCDDRDATTRRTFIYVAVEIDPRQLAIVDIKEAGK